MAFLGIAVPAQTARLIAEVDYGGIGQAVPSSEYHITMIYLGKDVPIETISAAIPAIFSVTSRTKPFTVQTSRASTFPGNEDGVPIIARIQSNALHTLRSDIGQALDVAGIEYSKKYPEYKPHLTLAYSSEPLEQPVDVEFPVIEWGAHELSLWGGDKGDNRLIVTFPLSIGTKEALDRAFVKLAANWRR